MRLDGRNCGVDDILVRLVAGVAFEKPGFKLQIVSHRRFTIREVHC